MLGGLSAVLALTGCVALPPAQPPKLTVGIISDVHLPFSGPERVRRAFTLFDRRKVDAVLICGDLTHYGLVRELGCIRDLWNEAFRDNRRSDGEPTDRPFFFVQHRVCPNTVEAHPWNTEWWCADCDASNALLREHGNAVAICGHAHSNLLNVRNFWRGDFTAVEVPSLSELAYPRSLGIDREETDETSVQCLIMNVWPNRVVFERLEASQVGKLARDWVVEL